MTTLAEVDALLLSLRKARSSGYRSTTHGDTSVSFSSGKDMADAIADLERVRAGLLGVPRRGVMYIYQRDKGL